ncbi:DUF2851 family protein [Ktedonospora formicarum]|uniref:DUF2851 family protein n=1 Tax=Ktedonospora formicarum TaxID=2778364 RepID=A0A8J3MRI7_9CHLR|nr:DUF2851 family protein [Ktedonospora formicarum]GHO43663.1 hypothetical protein KSX_18260 [Ktedonospora formicarum]
MMSALLSVRERTESKRPLEEEVERRWWALPRGTLLPLDNGEVYQLLFAGRSGGNKGPDIRDAVLQPAPTTSLLAPASLRQVLQTRRLCGDVEFHVRSSDWRAHHHERDSRYNQVILHIVLYCDDPRPTTRQDGYIIPTCTLADLTDTDNQHKHCQGPIWPCQTLTLPSEQREQILHQAGLLRFEGKCERFIEQLRATTKENYDGVLLPALAEALAYGRDRAFFLAAGTRLLGLTGPIPEPEGRSSVPSPLDANRLRVFARLVEQARIVPLWHHLCIILSSQSTQADENSSILHKLQEVFTRQGLSVARTDILVCNVILPFGAAIALLTRDPELYTRTRALYMEHPGLPSNRVTRMMSAQLQLTDEPAATCQQQGLHYIYQHTCRTKDCVRCIIGHRGL